MYFFDVLMGKVWDEIQGYRCAFLVDILILFLGGSCMLFHVEIFAINSVILIACSTFIILVFLSLKSIKLKYRFFWLFVAIFFSAICWVLFSYQSYYQGVRVAKSTEAQLLYQSAKVIIETDIPDDQKLQLLNDVMHDSKASIIIKKNDEDFFYQPHGRNIQRYIVEKFSDDAKQMTVLDRKSPEWDSSKYVPFNEIIKDGNKYQYSYEYANKPYMWIGIARAISWSVLPDLFYTQSSFNGFIIFRLYERSLNFWAPFFLLFCSGILVSFSTTKLMQSENELKRSNQNLQKVNNKLAIFQNTYEKIQRDFAGVVSNSKNNLQHMQSEWDKDFKAAAGLGRHDVLNRIKAMRDDDSILDETQQKERLSIFKQALIAGAENDNTILKDNYDFVLYPWIERIHTELKGLENTLDISLSETTVKHVLSAIKMGEPPDILNQKTEIEFDETIQPNIDQSMKCRVIISKIQSIVFNLISNSAAATESRLEYFIETGDDKNLELYVRKIHLVVTEVVIKTKAYLCITIQDNGGGFPEDILNKIYKEPVRTTKDAREYGQGTSYIGFFVDLMPGARIEARNIQYGNGETGASTILYIPVRECE